MAATETIRFAEPAQLRGLPLRATGPYLSPDITPVWRHVCLLAACLFCSQTPEPRL